MPKYDPKNKDFEEVPTIGPQNPNAVRVEASDTMDGFVRNGLGELHQRMNGKMPWSTVTPNDIAGADMALNAASGASLGNANAQKMFAAPLQKIGSKARSLVDFIGGKLSGLTPEMVQAYKAAPKTIEALVGSPELRQSQFAEHALNTASNRLGSRAGQLTDELQQQFAGKSIPENEIRRASQFAPKALGIDQNVPVKDVYAGAQSAGKAARFAPGAIDPTAEAARVEDAGREFGVLRGAVSKAVPEADPTIESLQKGIEAQKGLKGGVNKPLSYFESGAPDTAANRQAADSMVNSTRLERTAGQLQAAKQLGVEPHKLASKLLKPVGKTILRADAAVAPTADKALKNIGRGAYLDILENRAPRIQDFTGSKKLNIKDLDSDDLEEVR